MNTIYKDGKEIIQCVQYYGDNIKEVGDFLNLNNINWGGPRGGPYRINCTHGNCTYGCQELNNTDWLLKRQNDFVVMTDQDFQDTYKDMIVLRPLCTDFTNAGTIGSIGDNPIGLEIIDPLKEKFQVSNLKPLVIPPALTFKPASLLTREDEFVLTITTAFIKTGSGVEIGAAIKALAREVMEIANQLKEENDHGN
jgi:hypothetical protein